MERIKVIIPDTLIQVNKCNNRLFRTKIQCLNKGNCVKMKIYGSKKRSRATD